MKLSNIATNPEMEKDGIWVNFLEDVRLKIARHGTPKYMEFLQGISKEHKAKLRSVDESVDLLIDLTNQCLANVVLIDWEGVQDEDGNETEYTPELGLETLRDPAFHDFKQFILKVSMDAEEYRILELEDSVKNS